MAEDKLVLSNFPESTQRWIQNLQRILWKLDAALVGEHRQVAEDAPHHFLDDIYLQDPAVYSLLAYGAPGLEALFEISVGHSAAATTAQAVLVSAAIRDPTVMAPISRAERFLDDEPLGALAAAIEVNLRNDDFADHARRLVARLLRAFLNDDTRRDEIGSLLTITNDGGPDNPATSLLWDLIAKSVLSISDELCDELQHLVGQDLDENAYQRFLEQHPAILDPLASSVIPSQRLGEMYATDFVLRRLDDEYIFVEIEKPRDRLFTEYPQPSERLSHAMAQVLSWLTWVEDNIAYALTHGYPNIHSPKGLIIIGRSADLSQAQVRMLRQLNDLMYPRIRITPFDELIVNARNVLKNLTTR